MSELLQGCWGLGESESDRKGVLEIHPHLYLGSFCKQLPKHAQGPMRTRKSIVIVSLRTKAPVEL